MSHFFLVRTIYFAPSGKYRLPFEGPLLGYVVSLMISHHFLGLDIDYCDEIRCPAPLGKRVVYGIFDHFLDQIFFSSSFSPA